MKVAPAFTFHLNHPIETGLACIGKYDGKRPSLTCATSSGKILIHCPHSQSENYNRLIGEHAVERQTENPAPPEEERIGDTRFLNINRKITGLAAGSLSPDNQHDTLFVGTQTNLLAYDVENNADIFYKKDIPDGVGALVLGLLPKSQEPLVLVGGNCSIQGFNATGVERFWTVTGDRVSSMSFVDFHDSGGKELLVGSDDFEVRVFSSEEVVSEITESDQITMLQTIAPAATATTSDSGGSAGATKWAYSLSNGKLWISLALRVWLGLG
ncbi:unnamed protein product [Discosporangium mesarthrocarpum]